MHRTQIYLTKSQHRALRRASDREGVSMTELLRRMIDRYVVSKPGKPEFTKEAVMSFVGLGESGRTDVSERHDAALDEAFRGEALR